MKWELVVNAERYDISSMVYKFLPEDKLIKPVQSVYEQRIIAFYEQFPQLITPTLTETEAELHFWRHFVNARYNHFMDWEMFQHIKTFSFDLQGKGTMNL